MNLHGSSVRVSGDTRATGGRSCRQHTLLDSPVGVGCFGVHVRSSQGDSPTAFGQTDRCALRLYRPPGTRWPPNRMGPRTYAGRIRRVLVLDRCPDGLAYGQFALASHPCQPAGDNIVSQDAFSAPIGYHSLHLWTGDRKCDDILVLFSIGLVDRRFHQR
jgi:hypothetical protein